MTRWFRFYECALDDPKVQRLPPVLFKTWVNLLCLASRSGGRLPSGADISFALRLDEDVTKQQLTDLRDRGLLDVVEGAIEPHNWHTRQFKSDSSAERVAKHRATRKGNVSPPADEAVTGSEGCNVTSAVTETPPETDTDTDQSSDPDGSDAPVAASSPDSRDLLWTEGVTTLAKIAKRSEPTVRTFVGKCLRQCGDDAATVLSLIRQAEADRVGEPMSWMQARFQPQAPPGAGNPALEAVRRRMAAAAPLPSPSLEQVH